MTSTCPEGHQSAAADYCDVCGEAIAPVPGGTSSAVPAGGGLAAELGPGAAAPPAAGLEYGSAGAATPQGPVGGAPSQGAEAWGASTEPGGPPLGGEACSNCGSPRSGRFCEVCGADSALPAPSGPPAPAAGPGAPAYGPGAPAGPSAPIPDSSVRSTGAPGDPRQAAESNQPSRTGPDSAWIAIVRADHDWFVRAAARGGPDARSITFPSYVAERRFNLAGPEMMIGKRDPAQGIEPDIDLGRRPEDSGISRSQAVLRERPDGGWEVIDIGSTNGTVVGDSVSPIPEFSPVALADGDSFHIGAWTTVTMVRRT